MPGKTTFCSNVLCPSSTCPPHYNMRTKIELASSSSFSLIDFRFSSQSSSSSFSSSSSRQSMNRQRRQIIDHPSLRKKEEVDLWEGERGRERKEERDTNQKSGSRKITIGENNNNNENLIRNDGYFLFLYGAQTGQVKVLIRSPGIWAPFTVTCWLVGWWLSN